MSASVQWEWRILDCEEEEWAQVVQGACGMQPQVGTAHLDANSTRSAVLPSRQRSPYTATQWLGLSLVLLVLAAGAGWRLWQDAQRGVALIQQDITNAVTLETVKASTRDPALGERPQVSAVDFQADNAMVQVVVTHTAACGTVVVQRQTRFYAHGPQGWLRSAPLPAFWGDPAEYETPHLLFRYRELDRAAVEQVAQEADALAMMLGELFAVPGTNFSARTTVEVVPFFAPRLNAPVTATLVVASPRLSYTTSDRTDAQVLAWELRRQLVNGAIEQALARHPVQPQWVFMAEALRAWLLTSKSVPLGNDVQSIAVMPQLDIYHPVRLPLPYLDPYTSAMANTSLPGQPGPATYRVDEGELLVTYLANRYGTAGLAALYTGLGRYRDWDDLAPAVYGISAQQLQAEWAAAMNPDRR